MIHAVMVNILEKMMEVYGGEFVELIDGKIYVTDEDINACCEIQVALAE